MSETNPSAEPAEEPVAKKKPGLNLDRLKNLVINMPSQEEMTAERLARTVGALDAARSAHPETDIFRAVSLEDWSRIAAAAGVPAVGAEVVCRVPLETIMNFEAPRESDDVHWKAMAEARRSLKADEMMRWDCCASLDMKLAMADGGIEAKGRRREYLEVPDPLNPSVPMWKTLMSVDDPRFFDIVMEFPGTDVALIKRPWVEARREGTHPVEYRVFVENGEILGLANYYVQRDLPLSDTVKNEVAQCLSLTQQLLDHMGAAGAVPFNCMSEKGKIALGLDETKASCTIDYLVDRSGKVLFLEAGPPFGLGAHPCAFMENLTEVNGRERISVEGVCLELKQPPLPLSDFLATPLAKKNRLGA